MHAITVLTYRLPEALKAIEKLVKKANRFGNAPIAYTVGESFVTTRSQAIKTEDGVIEREVKVSQTVIEFSGEAPKIAGYDFLGRIEFTRTGGSLLHALREKEIPEQFRSDNQGHCDHCKAKRFRKDVYILQHEETGAYLQVGRTCLHDFLGLDVPEYILGRFDLLRVLNEKEEEFSGFGGGYPVYYLPEVLAYTSFCIRNFGWASSQSDYPKIPTKETVLTLLACKSELREEYKDKLAEQFEQSQAEAQAVISWVREELQAEGNYQNNLKEIFKDDCFYNGRLMGLVCSSVKAYQKVKVETQEKEERLPSEFIGEEGKRLRGLEALVQDFRNVGVSDFGELHLIKFLVDGKNEVVWFTTSEPNIEVGSVVKIDGTVKAFKEYRGVKQTTLSRVKVA